MSATEREVVLSFEPRGLRLVQVDADGQRFSRLQFEGAQWFGSPGEPWLPAVTVLVGIPEGVPVRVSAEAIETRIFPDVRLLPAPQLEPAAELTEARYVVDNSVYGASSPWPSAAVRVAEQGRFRDQPVAWIVVTPLQFHPSERRLEVYVRLIVRIEFAGEGAGLGVRSAPGPSADEAWYSANLINYEQARRWRLQRRRRPEVRKRSRQTGPWYKLFVAEEGIYRVSGKELSDRGIPIAEIDPGTLRLYNNGGRELPRSLSAARPDRLIENPITVVDGGDDRFDEDDFFLFYGRGVSGFAFEPRDSTYHHYLHHYTNQNVYWLTWGGQQEGKRIPLVAPPPPGGRTIEVVRDRVFVEEELQRVFRSGLDWYGWLFAASDATARSRTYTLDLPSVVASEPGKMRLRFYGGPKFLHRFAVRVNGTVALEPQFRNPDPSAWVGKEFEAVQVSGLVSGTNRITFEYSASAPTAQTYLDWFTLEYSRRLVLLEGELAFSAPADTGMALFRVEGGSPTSMVFEVSRLDAVRQLPATVDGNVQSFADTLRSDRPRRYVLVEPHRLRAVERVEVDAGSDLRRPDRGAEFIILTYDDFYPEALRLESLREDWDPNDRLETAVVRISNVFDEFSWGLYDATAVRDFLKYAYDNWNPRPRYVLLMGDGDSDPKNLVNQADRNWIPTYQNRGDHELTTLTSDQWFTFVSGEDQIMDLAIGRLTVRSLAEARDVVDKIIRYQTQPEWGDWRQMITLVGDDLLGPGGRETSETLHIEDTEEIAQRFVPDRLDVHKIYLSEYPAVRSASISGVRKPTATADLLERINRGTLVVNFIGHGDPHVWTHEHVLNHFRDFDKIDNGWRLPLFIAATCDFGRFDDPHGESMAEDLLRAPGRGAIGVLSAARLVYASPNADFNRRFLSSLFAPLNRGGIRRLGDAFVVAANTAGFRGNSLKFHLLADPTLRLQIPRLRVRITEVSPDSLRALSRVRVKGRIESGDQVADDFNGSLLLKVFDSEKEVNWRSSQGGYSLHYWLPGGPVFRGPVAVRDGRFTAEFIVPKDLNYGGRRGRISAYGWSADRDAMGARGDLPVGGTETEFQDEVGPEVRIYFEGRPDFVSGDVVGVDPVLVADIADSISGVNITGAIGHGITLTVDDDRASRIDLTPAFMYEEGSFTRGTLRYPLRGLDPGRHTLELKAWDNANNSRVERVEFVVVDADELVLRDVWNYPNPFSSSTAFTCVVSREGMATIRIYTLAGRLIRVLEDFVRPGFNVIEWDGLDADGDRLSNGVYLYRITVTAVGGGNSAVAEGIGKLVVRR